MLLARLKPHNPRMGYVMATFGMPKCKRPDDLNKDVLNASLLFTAGESAIEVTPEDAKILREVREVEGNVNSPLAFQVWDPATEPTPPEMVVIKDDKGQGITSAALRASYVPRSEIDGMIARAVAAALAARDGQERPAPAPPPAPAVPVEGEKKEPATEKVSRYFPQAEKGKSKDK